MLISVERTDKNQLELSQERWGCSSDVTLFFANKSFTKTDRCAGALLVLQFSARFLLTASLRRRRILLPTHETTFETEISLMQQFL